MSGRRDGSDVMVSLPVGSETDDTRGGVGGVCGYR